MKKVQLYLNTAGHCYSKENHVIRGGRKQEIEFKALYGLIKHDEMGWILYDTGYTDRFFDATKRFPSSIYAKITKVEINKEDEVVEQLQRFGIAPGEIKHIIITHFHADHVCGLKDFPNATFYCSKKAFDYTMKLNKIISFSKGVLKDLLPENMVSRVQFIEEIGSKFEDAIFGTAYDLFGDNSIHAFNLPGHAKGQMGIKLATKKDTYFLVADACWVYTAFTEKALPNPIVRLFFSSWKDYKETINKLATFHQQHPTVKMIPTHCNETINQVVPEKFDLHAL